MKQRIDVVPILVFAFLLPVPSRAKEVEVFILAGQSNMEGKAKVSLMEYQVEDGKHVDLYAPFRSSEGKWIEREDVWIKFLNRKGRLTVGFGSPDRVGPELGFGVTVGNAIDSPVLLIKTAWGGKSLFRDFRPPGSGLPEEEVILQDLEKARKRKPGTTREEVEASYGHYYRLMIEEVKTTLESLEAEFPQLEGHAPRIAGMVWFQGWNDMVNPAYVEVYGVHMTQFIRDVRKDLSVPAMPFVIGQLGVGGADPAKRNERRDQFKENQAAPLRVKEFEGNVALVKTDRYWDESADAVFEKGWKQNIEAWEKVGSDYPFHYLGSPRTFLGIGTGFGEAMLELLKR